MVIGSERIRRPVAWYTALAIAADSRRSAKPLGIAVHDHIIVGKDGHASLKELKLI
jgi:hypothetical protein